MSAPTRLSAGVLRATDQLFTLRSFIEHVNRFCAGLHITFSKRLYFLGVALGEIQKETERASCEAILPSVTLDDNHNVGGCFLQGCDGAGKPSKQKEV